MAADLTPVTRPDGRTYVACKAPRAWLVDNEHWQGDDPAQYVYVLGTHDVQRAHQLAATLTGGADVATAEKTWVRNTFRYGDPVFEYDPARGAAAVIFEVNE